MSVHLQIKEQINKFIDSERKYRELDKKREQKIEEVIILAKENNPFTLLEINSITEEMNNFSRSNGFPLRKKVTKEMVYEYVNRK